jgi:ATP-binding protein involved in chromosome partitioning
MVNEEKIIEALKKVQDPELHRDVISLGMIRDVKVSGDLVQLTLVLTTPACPVRVQFEKDVRAAAAFKVPFLGEIPLVPDIRAGSDSGHPLVLTHPDSPAAQAFTQVARKLAASLSILAAGQGAQPQSSAWKI